jgi:hypothetical protein
MEKMGWGAGPVWKEEARWRKKRVDYLREIWIKRAKEI